MRSQLVGPMLALVREAGGDAAALRKRFDLPRSAETEAELVLPLEQLHAFFDAAEQESRDRFIGVHVARSESVAAPTAFWSSRPALRPPSANRCAASSATFRSSTSWWR